MFGTMNFYGGIFAPIHSTFTVGKRPVQTIHSFDEVQLIEHKPLVLVDIDETLLTFDKKYSDFVKEAEAFYDNNEQYAPYDDNKHISREHHKNAFVYQTAGQEFNSYLDLAKPRATDLEGFLRLVKRTHLLGGDLKFLTARSFVGQDYTRSNFKDIGLEYDEYEVHYTNAHPKGEYIKKNINTDNYTEIIFIDDLDDFIRSVQTHLPQSQCYKFVYT